MARPLSSASQIELSCGTYALPSASFTETDEPSNGDVWIVRASWRLGLARAAPAETATQSNATKSTEPTTAGRRETFLGFIDSLQAWMGCSFGRRYLTWSPGN